MLSEDTANDFIEACDAAGTFGLGDVTLDKPTRELLEVTEHDLDAHVVLQPAGLAYYGALKREAARRLEYEESRYERWCRKRMALARKALIAEGDSFTKDDIKARFTVDDEEDIEKWEKRLNARRRQLDAVESWYEAWRTKGFTIRDFVESRFGEVRTTDYVKEKRESGTDSHRESISRVRKIQRRAQ